VPEVPVGSNITVVALLEKGLSSVRFRNHEEFALVEVDLGFRFSGQPRRPSKHEKEVVGVVVRLTVRAARGARVASRAYGKISDFDPFA
jgi:hypothetical protein